MKAEVCFLFPQSRTGAGWGGVTGRLLRPGATGSCLVLGSACLQLHAYDWLLHPCIDIIATRVGIRFPHGDKE